MSAPPLTPTACPGCGTVPTGVRMDQPTVEKPDETHGLWLVSDPIGPPLYRLTPCGCLLAGPPDVTDDVVTYPGGLADVEQTRWLTRWVGVPDGTPLRRIAHLP